MPLSSALPVVALLTCAVVIYAGLYLVVVSNVRTNEARAVRRGLRPTIIGAALFSLLIVLFAAVAAPLRYEPTTGLFRDGDSREVYQAAARIGLMVVYLFTAVAAALIGAALASRHERAKLATVTVVGVVLFMVVIAPLTEGLSECYANVTLVLRPSC